MNVSLGIAVSEEPTLRDLLSGMINIAAKIDVFDALLDVPLKYFGWLALAVVAYLVLLGIVTRRLRSRRARSQPSEAPPAEQAPE